MSQTWLYTNSKAITKSKLQRSPAIAANHQWLPTTAAPTKHHQRNDTFTNSSRALLLLPRRRNLTCPYVCLLACRLERRIPRLQIGSRLSIALHLFNSPCQVLNRTVFLLALALQIVDLLDSLPFFVDVFFSVFLKRLNLVSVGVGDVEYDL